MKTRDVDVNSDIWPKNKSVTAETCLWWPELEFFLAKTFGLVNSMDNSWRKNFLSLRMLLKYFFFGPYDISIERTCVHHLHEKSIGHLFCPPHAWVLSCQLVSCSYSTFCSVVMQDYIRFISPFWAGCLIAINLCGCQDPLFFDTYETRAMLSVKPKCLKTLPFRKKFLCHLPYVAAHCACNVTPRFWTVLQLRLSTRKAVTKHSFNNQNRISLGT